MPLILVVDDEPYILSLLEELLSEEGYQVATAANGAEGLRIFAAKRPDLVLADVQMPLLSGPELLLAIQQGPLYRPVPAVLMSANSAGAVAFADIYDAFLPKPLDLDLLLRLVAQLLTADR